MRLTDPIIREGPQLGVAYVAFDSLGVKSMCVRVETPEMVITVDPGVAAEGNTFPLPADKREALLKHYQQAVRESCARSQAVVVSHYHLDHFHPARDAVLYGGKSLFARDPAAMSARQAETATRFFKSIDGLPRETVWADGRKFKSGKTVVEFTPPVWHGAEDAEPGTVIMTTVSRGREKVLISSDVGGPLTRATTDAICSAKAQTVIVDGYPTYQLGRFATDHDLVRSVVNLCRILATPDVKTLVADHHLARDYRYPALFRLAYAKALKLRKRFGTAAEVSGGTSRVLEGYRDYGPTRWQKWEPLEAAEARSVLERAAAAGKLDSGWLAAFDRWVV
jgi:predicted metallo-beta-lactamase superfamily hydrolase